MSYVGQTVLRYKTVNMKRVVGCWKEKESIAFVCETKKHELFAVELGRGLEVTRIKAFEEFLGTDIKEAYASGNLALVKDRSRWKYYKITANNSYDLLDEVDCEKAFIGSEKTFYYLQDQNLVIKTVKGDPSEPIPFKYPSVDKVHYVFSDEDSCFLIAGIRFFRICEGKIAAANKKFQESLDLAQNILYVPNLKS